MTMQPEIYIALSVLNESENIKKVLSCISLQSFRRFEVVVCVNQYDNWWNDPKKVNICYDNFKSIELLKRTQNLNIYVIDRCTPGSGWPEKKGGVGWARKTIMDYVVSKANKKDIIVSMDADTYYPADYLQSIVDFFNTNMGVMGLSIPYYHKLNDDIRDRLILRYEIYMRYYLLNMMRINNPYSYTALGSAMAFPVWAYKKAGGLTPVAAGEDFYFLQKLVKLGSIGIWSSSVAYPSSRFSDRVLFGTGPALIKGQNGDWLSYPHYHFRLFDKVAETYNLFGELYSKDVKTPMDEFLKEQTSTDDIWGPLRKNYKDQKNFILACTNKVDGLRILQFLRKQQTNIKIRDEKIIFDYLNTYCKNEIDDKLLSELRGFDYSSSSIILLNDLRDFLFLQEMNVRKTK
ncbi:MAG: glycosyltransferase [Bacteroidetes bacterium]|nr:glycosyltransferase [Bacteroidota bacterium]